MLTQFLQDKTNIALITHQRPNGDAIGYLLGMYGLIQANFPTISVVPVLLDSIPEYLIFLPGSDKIQAQLPEDIDGLITLDSATLYRTGLDANPWDTLCIDHHVAND